MLFSIKIPPFNELKLMRQYWSWQEIQWGKANFLVSNQDVISYSFEMLDEGRNDLDVLISLTLEPYYSDDIDRIIEELCKFEKTENVEQILLVWRTTILKWLSINEKSADILEQKINMLYADFGYPVDMEPLIGYMPDLSGHTLHDKWDIHEMLKEYLEQNYEY